MIRNVFTFSKIISIILFGLGTAVLGNRPSEAFSVETVLDLKYVSQPSIDPSGKYIAYTLSVPRSADDKPGRSFSEIWVADILTETVQQYTRKPDSSASSSWTPDGSAITFLSKRKDFHKHKQIYSIPVDGGEASPLFLHAAGVSSYRWSPDGEYIAFLSKDPKTDQEKAAKKTGRDWIVFNENLKFTRLWVYDIAAQKAHQVFKSDLNIWNYTWNSNSRSIVFQATEKAETDHSYMFRQIYSVSVKGGVPRKVCTTEGKLGSMDVSPDGKTLAFLGATSMNDPLSQSVFLVPLKGGDPVNLTPGAEQSFHKCLWLDDNNLLLRAVNGTSTRLIKLNINSREREATVESDQIIYDFTDGISGNGLAIVANSAQHPNELFFLAQGTTTLKPLTNHNKALEAVQLTPQETIHWFADDSLNIAGVLTYPVDYREGRQYPLLLQIHGGPEGVSLDGWTTTTSTPIQLLAQNGFLVLQPNYRGSGGRGVEFSKADHDDLGGLEFDDVLAGVDYLINQGMVDPDRLGTGGWSYGGYLSAWAATRHSHRFKAAMVGAGISNWISFTGTTDIPVEMSLVHWNSWWFNEPQLHWDRSPLAHINKAQTPTLVVHGQKDDRVHPEQGLELYQALRIKGVDTRLVLYPRQPHGLKERAHRLDYMNRLVDWFNKYVK
ncbi:MAG: S9 family peptidase [Candidatus Neomarinimicrobiota bacterium]